MERRASVRPRPRGRRRRLRRILPPARRARGLRATTGSRRAHARSPGDVAHGRRRRRRRRRRRSRGVRRRLAMTEPQPLPDGNGKPPGTTSSDRSSSPAGTEMRSYYGRPVLKEPVWQREIPWYLFTGGLGGASAVLSTVARIAGNERLARRSIYIGAASDAVSPLLLISDLGRPERFLNMLRVFKVTSPMSVGSWILAFSSAASSAAAFLNAIGRLRRISDGARAVAALSGAPLAVYTGTLLADTAIPVWHEARHELP